MPITNLRRQYPRLGRISCGWQDAKPKTDKAGKPKTDKSGQPELQGFPRRSKTLVIHSDDTKCLEVWAAHCGGEVQQSPLDDEKYFLQTALTGLPIVLAPGPLEMALSQWMEAWTSAGLARKCTGEKCVVHRLAPKEGEVVGELSGEEIDCICNTEGLHGSDKACKPVVRLAVLPADFALDLPGIGVWMVTSGGWASNTSIASDIEMIDQLVGLRPGLRLELVVKQVKSAHGDVPMLSVGMEGTIREALALAPAASGPMLRLPVTETPALEAAAAEGAIGTYLPEPDEEPTEAETVPDAPTLVGFEAIAAGIVRRDPPATPRGDTPGITAPQTAKLVALQHAARLTDEEFASLALVWSEGVAIHDLTTDDVTAFGGALKDAIEAVPVP